MKIKEARLLQEQRLKEICEEKNIQYDSILSLLDSVKTKKLFKRNNSHQQKIGEVIENEKI